MGRIIQKKGDCKSLGHIADQLDELFEFMVGGVFHPGRQGYKKFKTKPLVKQRVYGIKFKNPLGASIKK
jgi:hypothetical protein